MISILMPIYNGIEFIDESVTSIQQQTYKDWQLLIGINGHPPESLIYKTACKYKSEKIKVFDFHTIKGKPAALNELIKHSTDVCCLLDVDDKWLPLKLQRQIEVFSDYDIVGTNCQYFGDRDDYPKIPLGKIDRLVFNSMNPVINSSSMFKKQDAWWNDVDTFGVEDYDMWLRLNHGGKKFFNVPEVLTLHRIHKQSCFNTQNTGETADRLRKKWFVR